MSTLPSISGDSAGAEAVLRSIAAGDDDRALSEEDWLGLLRLAADWRALPPIADLIAVPSSVPGPLWHLESLRNPAGHRRDAEVDQARRRYHARCAAHLMAPADPRMRPLVTVLIPAFNRVGPLAEAVESCLRQTWRPLEIDVVDDGSNEDIAGALLRYGPSVQVHRKEHGGVSSARNLGIRVARGDFVHFLDSDDLLLPAAVARKVEAFLSVPDAGVCYSNVEDQVRPWPMSRLAARDLVGTVAVRHPFLIPTVMMPRWLLLDAQPFEEDLQRVENSRYWFTLALRGTKAIGLDEVATIRRKLGSSLSDLRLETEEETFTVRARNLCDILDSPRHWRYAAGYYAQLVETARQFAPYPTVTGNAGRALARLQAKLTELAGCDRVNSFSALPLFAALRAVDNSLRRVMRPGQFGDDLDRLFAAVPAIIGQGVRASAPLAPRDVGGWLNDETSYVPQPFVANALDRLRARKRCGPGDVAVMDWILRRVPLPLDRRAAKRFRRLRRWTVSSRLAARLVWHPWRRSRHDR